MNWNYVVAGYALTAGTLGAYVAWIKLRTRRLRRALDDRALDNLTA
jgi:heme exporter protein CcmD